MNRIAKALIGSILALVVTFTVVTVVYLIGHRAGIIQPADPAAKKQARPF